MNRVNDSGDSQTSVRTRQWDSSLFDESWDRGGIPNRIFLMVKDAKTVFVYWTIDETRKKLAEQHFQCAWRQMPLHLQLYDVTDIRFDGDNAHFVTRISVDADADNWYIHNVNPRRNYIVDFGTLTRNGSFFTLLRSNVAETPPETGFHTGGADVWFAARYVQENKQVMDS